MPRKPRPRTTRPPKEIKIGSDRFSFELASAVDAIRIHFGVKDVFAMGDLRRLDAEALALLLKYTKRNGRPIGARNLPKYEHGPAVIFAALRFQFAEFAA